jgi:putative transposase
MGNFTDLYYHCIWSTKNRERLISEALEPELYGYIRGKCSALNVLVHALDGDEDHSHLVCSIPPTLAVAEFLHKIKGSSGHEANQLLGTSGNFWQPGYGALTLARKDLSRVIEYVLNQKEHHRNGTLWTALEREDE